MNGDASIRHGAPHVAAFEAERERSSADAVDQWTLAAAGVIGRDHRAVGRGGQDAFAAGAAGDLAWGVVSDGCGSGARSEVGAALTVARIASDLPRLLRSDATLDEIPSRAIGALVEALAAVRCAVVGDLGEPSFVRDHLLATVVAFAIRGDSGVVFWQGDGAFLLGDTLVVLDDDDRPAYAGYALLGSRTGTGGVAFRCFDARTVPRIAVATDGFDPDVLGEVFGHSPSALRRLLNVRAKEGRFADDASVVAARSRCEERGPAR